MTEAAKGGAGRPPKHARSQDDLAMHAMLRAARATARGLVDSSDAFMKRITTITPQLRAQMRAGYESTTPVSLIPLYEAATEGLLSADASAEVIRKFNEQQSLTRQARVDGQKERRSTELNDKDHFSRHECIQRLISRLEPAGNLSPNGAATLARRALGDLMQKPDVPSHRTLRRFFTSQQHEIVAR